MIARAALLSLVASMAAAQTLNIPTRSGDIISLPKASVITGDEDFGNKEFDRGTPCDSDEDTGSENAVFILQDGASISNVIIGADSLEGVHCLGSCTLTNVWFRDVCEDAISVLGTGDALIVGGGAREAIDKVVQHNGPGTVTIRNYTIVNAGKLYRSCGDCTNNSKKSPRHVIVENVRAFGLKSDLIGINPNFGDTASITGSCGSTKQVCSEYTGVDKGNGKSQRLGTTEKCSGDQGKLEKLPECDASGDEPSTPVEPTSTQAATTSSPTTLVTKTSAQQTPVQPTPVEPTPTEPTPVEPTPVEPSPVEPSPVEPTPAEPTPTECDESKTVPLWGRCGGKGYTGPTTCASGKCVQFNPWYSQCV